MKAFGLLLLGATFAQAQLAVTVSPVKVTGLKAIVPVAMVNNFTEKVESARAVVFLLDEQGKATGQPTARWVIGTGEDKSGLAAGATNVFNFVLAADKPFTTTNLTAKVQFTRVVLEGGKVADVTKAVNVIPATK
jgi:hypothetical protein